MRIRVKGDLAPAMRFLSRVRKQIPFATSVAINNTLSRVQDVEKKKIKTELEQPTPGTVKAIRLSRSNKHSLTGAVFILPAVSNFLRYSIEGGTRPPRGRSEFIPVDIRLNKYGNIPGRRSGKVRNLVARNDTFIATIRGTRGLWKRGKGRARRTLQLLGIFDDSTRYKPQFKFYEHAEKTTARVFGRYFNNAIKRALRSAR